MSGVVDRLLAQLPGLQSDSSYGRSKAGQVVSSGGTLAPTSPDDLLGPWARLSLGLMLGITIAWWPYQRGCGFALAGYLGVLLIIILAAGWAAMSSWRHRSALAHTLSVILLVYGILLIMSELLPRAGYAVDRASWACEEAAGTPAPLSVTLTSE
jgi:hypothetical protein